MTPQVLTPPPGTRSTPWRLSTSATSFLRYKKAAANRQMTGATLASWSMTRKPFAEL
jgi:hypothetical protein